MNVVYGPVRSLRYGSTLGINLSGREKACSYNCVYCSLGPTVLTMNKMRKDYVFPTLDELRASFKEHIKQPVPTDAIVLSGNGEPTLYPEFEDAVKCVIELREAHLPGTKIVVLSNGAHLDSKKVVSGMKLADERVIKIDAGNDKILQKVNEPLIRLNMAKFLNGLEKLGDRTTQSLFCTGEVENTQGDLIEEWIEVMGLVKPKAVQLCTITRPTPVMPGLRPADEDALYSIAFKLKKRTGLEATVFGGNKS